MTIDDYVSTPADNYKFMASMDAPKPRRSGARDSSGSRNSCGRSGNR